MLQVRVAYGAAEGGIHALSGRFRNAECSVSIKFTVWRITRNNVPVTLQIMTSNARIQNIDSNWTTCDAHAQVNLETIRKS